MQAYGIRVPNPLQLADFLNRLEAMGLYPYQLDEISGQTFVIITSQTPPSPNSFMLLEDGSFLLQEDGSKLIL